MVEKRYLVLKRRWLLQRMSHSLSPPVPSSVCTKLCWKHVYFVLTAALLKNLSAIFATNATKRIPRWAEPVFNNNYYCVLESSSDEDSIVNEETIESTPERERPKDRSTPQMLPPPPLSDTSSTGSPPPLHHRPRLPPPNNWDHRNRNEITEISDVMQNLRTCEWFHAFNSTTPH